MIQLSHDAGHGGRREEQTCSHSRIVSRLVAALVASTSLLRPAPMVATLGLLGCGGSVESANADAGDAASRSSDASGEASLNGPDAGVCVISAANYDESCSVDLDCVRVTASAPVDFGNYCQPLCRCGQDVISRSSAAKFASDVAQTPLGSGAIAPGGCSCGGGGSGPCCLQGRCATGPACLAAPTDASDASNPFALDAASPPPGSVWCSAQYGQFDAAAPSKGPGGWCPGECSRYNNAWACCSTLGVGVLCIPYSDAGMAADGM